ncbi:MAG: mevalonate kinase [Promethearchaeota archaeon]|nr:MAG: mevalonate kinase [Candidatus Lokiarchaeota archaeon]
MKVVAKVPGKCILFGEHAVVYGYPALSMAIPLKSTCIVEEINDQSIHFSFKTLKEVYWGKNLADIGSRMPRRYQQFVVCLNLLADRFGLDIKSLRIQIFSDIFPNAGLGSSASTSISLLSALNEFYSLNLKKKRLVELGFEMERITHGNPSGIDHTTCLFGNVISFQKGKFHIVNLTSKFKLLVTYTNQAHDTREVVSNVRKIKERRPNMFDDIVSKIGSHTRAAEIELIKGNFEMVGKYMNLNQKLLSQLNISNEIIEKINKLALKLGAYGSKLTGAGLGGSVITLGSEEVLKKISKSLSSEGFWNIITSQDKKGAIAMRKT